MEFKPFEIPESILTNGEKLEKAENYEKWLEKLNNAKNIKEKFNEMNNKIYDNELTKLIIKEKRNILKKNHLWLLGNAL